MRQYGIESFKHELLFLQICVEQRQAGGWGGSTSVGSTETHSSGDHIPVPQVEPHKLVESDLHDLVKEIKKVNEINIRKVLVIWSLQPDLYINCTFS